ncbi:hypothetical protein Q5752_005872 [Cryptotrichosporon argae]
MSASNVRRRQSADLERRALLADAPARSYSRRPSELSQSHDRLRHGRARMSAAVDGIADGLGVEFAWLRRPGDTRHWADRLQQDSLTLPLFIMTFSCALADAVTYKHFQAFATSQTGNTIFLAVAAAGASPRSPLIPGVCLAGFIISGLLFGQIGVYIGHDRRGWLVASCAFQIAVLGLSALVVRPSARLGPDADWVYMLLMAIQGGPQVTMATVSGIREIPTAMMTTPYAALVSDPALFVLDPAADVKGRNRRVAYLAVFWAGALVGSALVKWSDLYGMTLAVIACKIAAGVLMAAARVWQDKGVDEDNDPFVAPLP